MKFLSKFNHLKSKTHRFFEISIIRRYIILNPNFVELDEKLMKYVSNYIKKSDEFDVRCLLKLITITIRVRYFRNNPYSSLH